VLRGSLFLLAQTVIEIYGNAKGVINCNYNLLTWLKLLAFQEQDCNKLQIIPPNAVWPGFIAAIIHCCLTSLSFVTNEFNKSGEK
jgi:hypothetical protein